MSTWIAPVASYMLQGLWATLLLAISATVASTIIGLLLGIALTAKVKLVPSLIRLYVELWRGLPLIVILFFVFFELPAIGFKFSPVIAAGIGLILWGSAVMAENVRGAIAAIPQGQIEAARSLGLRPHNVMWLVVLPQAARGLLPPTLNLVTSLIHATSLSAALGALELLEASQRSVQRLLLETGNSHSLWIFGGAMLMYFVVCYPVILLSQFLERRWAAS